jgi:hypothetical protein
VLDLPSANQGQHLLLAGSQGPQRVISPCRRDQRTDDGRVESRAAIGHSSASSRVRPSRKRTESSATTIRTLELGSDRGSSADRADDLDPAAQRGNSIPQRGEPEA